MRSERSWHEQQLLADLAEPIATGNIEVLLESDALIRGLAARFPLVANRIDWTAVPLVQLLAAPPSRSTSSFELTEPATELREFWVRMRREHGIDDDAEVIVVGDALVTFGLRLSVATLTRHLVAILSIPHHTYVFPPDVSWCFSYTAEDEAFFAPTPRRSESS